VPLCLLIECSILRCIFILSNILLISHYMGKNNRSIAQIRSKLKSIVCIINTFNALCIHLLLSPNIILLYVEGFTVKCVLSVTE